MSSKNLARVGLPLISLQMWLYSKDIMVLVRSSNVGAKSLFTSFHGADFQFYHLFE